MLGAVSGAHAADMPDLPILRGAFTDGLTTTKVNWQGYYIGAQGGYGSSDENFSGATGTMVAQILANTTIENEMNVSQWPSGLGKSSARSSGFGGFAGYNSQWDDVVIGVEASYLHGNFGGSSSGSEERIAILSDGYSHDVLSTSTASIAISDMATLRARAGYAFGSFLPYMFGGFALGDADISRTVAILDVPTFAGSPPPVSPLPIFTPSLSVTQHGHLIYGYSGGLGFDVNLIGGLFMRAEWEYIRFTDTIDTSINTARVGLGYKF
jgi:opacity protein-like surface antigen